jgi:hypothetical protein
MRDPMTDSLSDDYLLAGLIVGAGFVVRAYFQSQLRQLCPPKLTPDVKSLPTHHHHGLFFPVRGLGPIRWVPIRLAKEQSWLLVKDGRMFFVKITGLVEIWPKVERRP